MKLTKTPDGYIVHVPDDVVAALGLKDGDGVDVRARTTFVEHEVDPDKRARALSGMLALARPLPPGYKFDREEANAR
jgi:antitoxin MazE